MHLLSWPVGIVPFLKYDISSNLWCDIPRCLCFLPESWLQGFQRTKGFAKKCENFGRISHFPAKINEANKKRNFAKMREFCENATIFSWNAKILWKPWVLKLQQLIAQENLSNFLLMTAQYLKFYYFIFKLIWQSGILLCDIFLFENLSCYIK